MGEGQSPRSSLYKTCIELCYHNVNTKLKFCTPKIDFTQELALYMSLY